MSNVDWLGLAMELEAQAKRVESQTVERAMLAGAHGLRLMGAESTGDQPSAALPRYGIRWNGPQGPIAVPMPDGYWTPWHLATGMPSLGPLPPESECEECDGTLNDCPNCATLRARAAVKPSAVCATCGGTGEISGKWVHGEDAEAPCPDCNDGDVNENL